jgi:hypothetical protein
MAKGREKSTPFDPMPDEWDCALIKAFARVTKFRGGDWTLAFHDIKQALADGRLPAAVRSLTDSRKWRELPIEFWQTARLSSSGDHIAVRSDEYSPMHHRYFMRQRDVDKLCPVSGGSAMRANRSARKKQKEPQVDHARRVLRKRYPPKGRPPADILTETLKQQVKIDLEAEGYKPPYPSWASVARAAGRRSK